MVAIVLPDGGWQVHGEQGLGGDVTVSIYIPALQCCKLAMLVVCALHQVSSYVMAFQVVGHYGTSCNMQGGYNLLFGLWKYAWDADCELFLKILKGELKEGI